MLEINELVFSEDFFELKNLIQSNQYRLILLQVENTSLFSELYSYFLSQRKSMILISKDLNNTDLTNLINDFQPDICLLFSEEFIIDYSKVINTRYVLHVRDKLIQDKNLIPSILLSTSGSTGSQKFVRISYENLLQNTKSIIESLSLKSSDITISNLPFHYSFGLSVLNTHLYCGAKVIFTEYSVIQKEFWDLVKLHNVTNLFGVPYTFEILNKIRFFKMDLPHLRLIGQAGGKMNLMLLEKYLDFCKNKNIQYFTMYGQTEATARMSYLPDRVAYLKKGSIGIPIPGGRFELRDEINKKIEDVEIEGELVYYGPNVSLGYAICRADLSKGDENKGVLYTGDLAKKDSDGYFYITGRKNRFLKLFGNRISLQEIEDKLFAMGIESVCGGDDDEMIVYLTDHKNIEFVKNLLPKFTLIHSSAFQVKFCEKIPRNSSGKILYNQLFKL